MSDIDNLAQMVEALCVAYEKATSEALAGAQITREIEELRYEVYRNEVEHCQRHRDATIWVAFAAECLSRPMSPYEAAELADKMVVEFRKRYPKKA